MHSRRSFLRFMPGALLGLLAVPLRLEARRRPVVAHPEPREGITGEGVVSAEQLRAEGHSDEVVALFDGIRDMPHIADGLACHCGCALLGNRSLLTCYHDGGMARGCAICQGEARIAIGRHAEGQSLDQIRRAIDARFG